MTATQVQGLATGNMKDVLHWNHFIDIGTIDREIHASAEARRRDLCHVVVVVSAGHFVNELGHLFPLVWSRDFPIRIRNPVEVLKKGLTFSV